MLEMSILFIAVVSLFSLSHAVQNHEQHVTPIETKMEELFSAHNDLIYLHADLDG